MKQNLTAVELIDLAKKIEKIQLKVLGVELSYKRINCVEAITYQSEPNNANLLFYTICNDQGEKVFEDKKQAAEFEENMPVRDWNALIKAVSRFNFPKLETIAGNY